MITSQRLLQGFFVFGILYSILILTGYDTLTWYLKPFLLPFLFYAVVKSEVFETKKWLLIALLFSWFGDCILMFADKSEMYFIYGLVAFLLAHVLFIILFSSQKSANKSFKEKLFWVGFLGATIYLIGILSLLIPSLGDLKFPVTAYALIITIMLKTALKGTFDWGGNSKYTVMIGAAFFVTSDSILAINKFHSPIPLANFWIMLTYLIAQFSITYGILKLNQKNNLGAQHLSS
ncbi:MAG TPA: lysoplasmalogenase [Flavobacterium sp.]|uniref:lysoplasmalogenase n=1 Tax=Flavobacterium sp. TaxID=239 RepID=UPI002CD1F4A8|nr:lysoplasmalogenase [Flavobacterium sp.]HNP32695.1 lysoplasmalogenase [Flavobacterium sp.]